MNPCALAPQDIDVTHHDVAGKCILMANRDEMVQAHERRQTASIATARCLAFDTNYMTSKLSGQHARRTAKATAHVNNETRLRHAGGMRELPNGIDATGVVLIRQLRFRINSQLQFRKSRDVFAR